MKKGTIICCSQCGRTQLKSTKDILPGQQMKHGAWESLGYDLDSLRMCCSDCATLWARPHPVTGKTQIFTLEDGWVSLDKEPNTKRVSLVDKI